jgi:aryl-alcohol dehydrogenase-like predicted oxidoreductase
MALNFRKLGSTGPEVSSIALGCMGMSGMYGPSQEGESIATIHAAMDSGINLLDTGDFYGMGHNEMLISRAIEGRRDRVLLSVKFGGMRSPEGAFIGMDGRPQAVKNFAAYSLQRLRTDHIDVYRLARLDPAVPIEDTIGAIADLVKAGWVRNIGMSEVGAETLRRAQAVHPITDLQIEYSLIARGIERAILPAARQLGIAITAYGVLSRGLLSNSKPAGPGDFRAHLPRFTGANQKLVDDFAAFAAARRASPAQLATAWVLSQGADIIPVLGARTRKQLAEILGALELELSDGDLAELSSVLDPAQVTGTRYGEEQMRMLDSER